MDEKVLIFAAIGAILLLILYSQKATQKKQKRKIVLQSISNAINGEQLIVDFTTIKSTIANDLRYNSPDFIDYQDVKDGFEVSYKNQRFRLTINDNRYGYVDLGSHKDWLSSKQKQEEKLIKNWEDEKAKKEQDRKERILAKRRALENSPLTNYFGAKVGGETTFYYLKLNNTKGHPRYKVGVTLNSVKKRYSGHSNYTVLYEEVLTKANTIERKILKEFNHLITYEKLLGTNGTEIFSEDVLRLDSKGINENEKLYIECPDCSTLLSFSYKSTKEKSKIRCKKCGLVFKHDNNFM